MSDRNTLYYLARNGLVFIEYSHQFKAAGACKNLCGNSLAKITCADKNSLYLLIYTQNLTDLVVELGNIVAIALLTETAEAVKVVSDL